MINIGFIDHVHQNLEDKLLKLGYKCLNITDKSREDLIADNLNYDGIVIRSRFKIDKEIIDSLPNLKFIARFGAGMENIDVAYAKSKGIACLRAPEGNMSAVAEQALGMLLSLNNRLFIARKEVKNGIWKREENRGVEIEGKTVGIIGYGFMGKAFVQRLKGFGCKILVHDKYLKIEEKGIKQVELKELQKEADIVSIHLPLSLETQAYVDFSFIANMAKDFVLINTARGNHVVSEDLLAGLESGKIKAACLDVLDREKSSFESAEQDVVIKKLLRMENVLITPHIAGWTHESNQKMADSLYLKIVDLKIS